MKKHTKYLIWGATLALFIFLCGHVASIYDEHHLSSLVDKCKTENSQLPKGRWLEYQKSPLVCDADELSGIGAGSAVGIQKKIIEMQPQSGRAIEYAWTIAIITFLLSCLPYFWYFLLDRIRELRNAFTGN